MKRTGVWLATLSGLLVALFVWAIIDEPEDTGVRVEATLIDCIGGGRTVPRWCSLHVDGMDHDIQSYIPTGGAGGRFVLAVHRRPLSGAIVYESGPRVGPAEDR